VTPEGIEVVLPGLSTRMGDEPRLTGPGQEASICSDVVGYDRVRFAQIGTHGTPWILAVIGFEL
jgi:hypothetical protein